MNFTKSIDVSRHAVFSLFIRALGIACLVFLLPLVALTQGSSASLEGYVYDTTSAVIPDTSITIVNTENSATRTVTSNGEGFYIFGQLAPGLYEIHITHTGFAPYRQTNIALHVGDSAKVNATLEVAGTREEIIVTESVSLIDTTQMGSAGVIPENEIKQLPVNNRNWVELALLVPGVNVDGEFDAVASVSVNGVAGVFNNVQVDGADNNNGFFGEIRGRTRAPFQFSQETIKEFRILTNAFSAEFGRAAGGVINAVTKSGTNDWHGSAHWFLRDSALNATPVLVKTAGLPKPDTRRQQFGGTIGGPIQQDKVFLFFSYEQQVREDPVSVILGSRISEYNTNPLDLFSNVGEFNSGVSSFMDAVDGNAFGTQTFCFSSCVDPLDNGIQQAEADTIHQAFLNWAFARAFFLGDTSFLDQTFTTPGGTIQTVNPFPGRTFSSIVRTAPRNPDQIVIFPKITWLVNDKNTVNVRYNFQDFESSPNGVFTAPTKADNNTADGSINDVSHSLVFSLDTALSSTLLNEFQFQFTKDDDDVTTNGPGLARIRLDDFDFAGSSSLPRFVHEDKLQFKDNFMIIKGRHQVRVGFDIIKTEDDNFFPGTFWGRYSFNGPGQYIELARAYFTEVLLDPVTGRDYFGIDTASGTGPVAPLERRRLVRNFQQRFGTGLTPLTTWDYGVYVQDTFRLNPDLTLNFGLRYEYQTLQDPILPNPLFPESAVIPEDSDNFAPRVGIAWSPQDDLVIRVGAGLFYLRRSQIDVTNAITGNNAFSFNQFLSSSRLRDSGAIDFNPVDVDPLNLVASDFPILSAPTTACPAPPACADPFAGVSGFAADYENGYTSHMHGEVQWEIVPGTAVMIGYTHVQGTNLPRNRNVNLLNPAPGGLVPWTFQDTADNVIQIIDIPDYDANAFSGNLPNGDFSAIQLTESAASSTYDAIMFKVERRISNGLTYGVSYTFSENTSDVINGINLGGVFFSDLFDQFNPGLDRGRSRLDRPHNFVTRFIWEPQNWKNSAGVARHALDGWSIGFIYTAGSGSVLTPVVSGDINDDNARTAFGAGDRVPFLARNSVRTQGKNNLDASIYKSFDVGEGRSLQFRLLAFNVTNRASFLRFNAVMFNAAGTTATLNPAFLSPRDRARRSRDIQLGLVFRF